MHASPLFVVFSCIAPAIGLVGFVMLISGIGARNQTLWRWGLALLIFGSITFLIFTLFGARMGWR